MITLPEVLECCTLHWQDHDAIAREFDRRFPLHWYSIPRYFRLLSHPDRPSVDLHSLLALAVQQGKLEHKLQETGHILIVKDATLSKPRFLYRLKDTKILRNPLKAPYSPVLLAA